MSIQLDGTVKHSVCTLRKLSVYNVINRNSKPKLAECVCQLNRSYPVITTLCITELFMFTPSSEFPFSYSTRLSVVVIIVTK